MGRIIVAVDPALNESSKASGIIVWVKSRLMA
jgi:hypothetical protein